MGPGMVEMPVAHKVTKSLEQKWISRNAVTFDEGFHSSWIVGGVEVNHFVVGKEKQSPAHIDHDFWKFLI